MGREIETFKSFGTFDKSMKESVTNLIEEMQEVKAAYPTLELAEILRIFNIDTMRELTNEIRRHNG